MKTDSPGRTGQLRAPWAYAHTRIVMKESIRWALLVFWVVSAEAASAGLRDVAAAHGLTYGCAASVFELIPDPAFQAAVAQECGSLSPTVGFKMSQIAVAPGIYDFRQADWLVAFAHDHGMTLRAHTLLWWKRVPDFLQSYAGADVTAWVQEYIRVVMQRYPDIPSWDVVNEMLSVPDSFWRQKLGPDYIAIALHAARAANPQAQLVISDYGLETNSAKRGQMLALATSLHRRGLLDAVGAQGHVTEGQGGEFAGFSLWCRTLPVPVILTEMDVTKTWGNEWAIAATYRALTRAAIAGGVPWIVPGGLSARSV